MKTIANHPSALALDLVALGHEAATELAEHLTTCQRCRARVAASAPVSGPVPAWVSERSAGRRWGWRWQLLATACAGALALFLFVPGPAGEELEVTRPKGQPSVAVYVEHQGSVRLWDGHSPVATGDRLQLKVAAAGFSHLVVGVAERERWTAAFTGPVSPEGETTLSQSFQVEADTTTLRLGLLLCETSCPADAVAAASLSSPRDAHRWWTSFTITRKEDP